jgi:xylitol oxidase
MLPLQFSQIRADEMWLSPTKGTDSLVIHFSMNKKNIPGVISACKELEAALLPLGCRPHWGKLHHMGHEALAQQ